MQLYLLQKNNIKLTISNKYKSYLILIINTNIFKFQKNKSFIPKYFNYYHILLNYNILKPTLLTPLTSSPK